MSSPEPINAPLGTPVLPEVHQHLVRVQEPVTGRVVRTRICTKSQKAAGCVRHIEIDVSGTPLQGAWHPGQSFGVIPPGMTKAGNPHKLRLYSIAAPSSGEPIGESTGESAGESSIQRGTSASGSTAPAMDGSIISTTTKRLIDEHWDTHELYTGVCSNYLCDLKVGDQVHMTGPVGKRFLLPADPSKHDYLFIATGTGIAPFRSMLGDLAKLGMPCRADLIMGAPYDSDLLYDDEMCALTGQFYDRFFYRTAISRHTSPDQPTKLYVQGRQTQDAPELTEMLNNPRTLIYICGIAGMELGIFKTLSKMLTPEALAQYLTVHPEIGTDPINWKRTMIPRKLKPTKRMFLEVY
ncbi:MAG: hypothetical protein AB8C13_04915 [Phycisphaerales bacterium]